MPLVLLSGFPGSGKSKRACELVEFFSESYPDKHVVVISDCGFSGFDKNVIYNSSAREKNLRAHLKSEVLKHLNADTIVILDSLNYIKGYRYELYCVSKSAQTLQCCIWCDISQEQVLQFNSVRSECDRYTDVLINELISRFEAPDSKNRWDRPLFIVQVDDTLPFEKIDATLFNKKPPAANLSTVAQPLQPTNFLYDLDRLTSDIVKQIVAAQKLAVPGGIVKVQITDSGEIKLPRHCTMAELNKIRRQFISFMKLKPVSSSIQLLTMFVQYVNNALS